jgi:prefoldin subunit 4
MRYGEIFVEGTEEESVDFVEKAKKLAREKFSTLDAEREKIDGEMKELKAILYAKFGSNINLETK